MNLRSLVAIAYVLSFGNAWVPYHVRAGFCCSSRCRSLVPGSRRSGSLHDRDDSMAPPLKRARISKRENVSNESPKASFSFLVNLSSDDEIIEVMLNPAFKDASSSWTSSDYTAFIRLLRDRNAYKAILFFLRNVARNDVFAYTVAISVLSMAPEFRNECFALLETMKQLNVTPLSTTCAALFQACANASEALRLADQLYQDYPSITWTPAVFESATNACLRSVDMDMNREKISSFWAAVDRFVEEMDQSNMMTPRIYITLLSVCAETADLPKALALYQRFGSGTMTPQMWGATLQVCAAAGDDEQAFDILQDMRNRGVAINVRHCTSYLNSLISANKMEKAMEFLNHMSANPSVPNKDTFENIAVDAPDIIAVYTLLKAFTAKKSYDSALELFRRIQKGDFGSDITPDEKCYNVLLMACPSATEAKELIRQMHLSRRYRIGAVPPDHIAYTRAITACRRSKDVESARFFLNSARMNKIPPDLFMYSAAIWTAAAAGDINAALGFLSEMQKNNISPNIVCYNGVIAAYASQGMVEGALNLYEQAVLQGLDPTRTTFVQLAASLRRAGEASDRLLNLERVREKISFRGYSIDVAGPVFEALISSYGSIGKFEEAFDSIEGPSDAACLRAITLACSMKSPPAWEDAVSIIHTSDIVAGSAPFYIDQIALGNAMLACSKANEWHESLQLFQLYGGPGTPIIAMNSLIAACGRGGRPDMAIEILTDMESYRLKADAISYRNAIIACNQAEHDTKRSKRQSPTGTDGSDTDVYLFQWWECALSLLRRMKEDGIKPDMQTYSSAISACEAAGEWQQALGILQSMMNEPNYKDRLNLYCFNAAIAACEKGGAWVESLDIFERMKGKGGRSLQPTVVTYGSIILALDNAGQKELAVNFYEEAVRKRIIRPWRITLDANGDRIRAIDLHTFSAAMARAALRSHLEALLSGKVVWSGEDLVIIVGKGLRSENEPVLMECVRELLQEEYKVRSVVDPNNNGRLVIPANALNEMMGKKGW